MELAGRGGWQIHALHWIVLGGSHAGRAFMEMLYLPHGHVDAWRAGHVVRESVCSSVDVSIRSHVVVHVGVCEVPLRSTR